MTASLNPSGPGWLRTASDPGLEGSASQESAWLPSVHQPRIGLALSGGGARGLAHVGVIQVLEEAGIPIAAVAGTSMGAYVGSLLAAGNGGARLEELAREIKDRKTLLGLLDPALPPSQGLIRGEKIRLHLERSLQSVTFADLKLPLLVVATDLDTLNAHVFDQGSVAAAVHASAAIPGICAPVCLNGRRYADGGAAEPMPVSLLKERFFLDGVIAVNVLPTAEDIEVCHDTAFVSPKGGNRHPIIRCLMRFLRPVNLLGYGNVLDTFRRALMSAQLRLVRKESRHAEVVIHPFFCDSTWFDFENFDRYIAAGRQAAEQALPAIHALLKQRQPHEPRHEAPLPHPSLGCRTA